MKAARISRPNGGADGNILQIWICRGQAPGRRAHLIKGSVHTGGGIGEQRQRIDISGFELGQLPVSSTMRGTSLMLGELLQDIHGGRNDLAPPILHRFGQLHRFKQHIPQLSSANRC